MKDEKFETVDEWGNAPIRIVIALVVVAVVAIVMSLAVPKQSWNQEPQAHIDFTPGDSYCADLPRLAAIYAKERETIAKAGDNDRERALISAALRDLTQLSEACAGEAQALRNDKFRVEHENQWLTECLVSDHCDCCSEGDGVVLVGCPEADK